MTYMDIDEFLIARLDEKQRLAEAAAKDASPRFNVDGTHWRSADGEYVSCEERTIAVGPYGYMGDAIANHVVANDPAHVLADIAAKRHLLEWCVEAVRHVNWSQANTWGSLRDDPNPRATHSCMLALQCLAAPDADHPDFKPEWRIDG